MAETSPMPYSMNDTTGVTDTNNHHRAMTAEEMAEYQEVKSIFDVAMVINKYYLWLLFALGFPGNCAAIVTIFRMRSIGTFPIFVVMLAIMDSLAIFVKLLFYQLLGHQVDMGSAGCCILKFLGSWTAAFSSWILVFMALERFMAVRFPLKMSFYSGCNARKAFTVLAVVGVVITLIYMPQLWTNQAVTHINFVCKYKPQFADFMNNSYFWISATVYAFVPFCLLTVFNFLIARQIRTSLKARSVMRNTQLLPASHGCFDLSIQRQVNLMLLSATVMFILLTFPICIFMVADSHWSVTRGFSRSNAIKFLCQQLAFVLVDSTHAVNFYLYFLTARRFRHHFLRLLTCKSCYCSLKSICRHSKGTNQSELEDL